MKERSSLDQSLRSLEQIGEGQLALMPGAPGVAGRAIVHNAIRAALDMASAIKAFVEDGDGAKLYAIHRDLDLGSMEIH